MLLAQLSLRAKALLEESVFNKIRICPLINNDRVVLKSNRTSLLKTLITPDDFYNKYVFAQQSNPR
ncbi:hypothetical protein CW304_06295 [Bacillus sp. UFRGS-B20]|nr:hypothetical protein CW304_06295 [Bacillus sp. UFRGS-B20]